MYLNKLSAAVVVTVALFAHDSLAQSSTAVSLPPCQSAAPAQYNLTTVQTAFLKTPQPPFGIAYGPQNNHAFVALNDTLGVLDTSSFPPKLLSQVALPQSDIGPYGAAGIVYSGGLVYITLDSTNVAIVNSSRAIAGSPDAVVGVLMGPTDHGYGNIEVTISKDGRFAFVSLEYGANGGPGSIDVFKVNPPSTNGSVSGSYVGHLPLGQAVVGTALSPDGKILYATSELSGTDKSNLQEGTLNLINVTKLETDPASALINNFNAGCNPVRVIASQDGAHVWVTARASNYLLAFDTAKLKANASNPLVTAVQVGTLPVGLAFAESESRILVADSNRYNVSGTNAGISVIDTKAALAGKASNLGQILSGYFPRELALSPDGKTMLVSNIASSQVEAVNMTTVP